MIPQEEPESTDHELAEFWRETRRQMVPDQISAAEAERRMATSAEPLPRAQVDRIVQEVLAADAPAPQTGLLSHFQRWGLPQLAAAGLLLMFLSAGVAYVMWPSNQDPSGVLGTDGLRADEATLILVDPNGATQRRRNALTRTFQQIKSVIQLLQELENESVSAQGPDGRLARVRHALQGTTEFHAVSYENLRQLVDRVRDPDVSEEDRKALVESLTTEAVYGVSSLFRAIEVGAAPELLSEVQVYIDKLIELSK